MRTGFVRRAVAGALGLVFATAANAAFGTAPDATKLQAQISAARAALAAHLPLVSDDLRAIPGLFSRLDADAANLSERARPPWMPESDFWTLNATLVTLDASLVDQLVTRKLHSVGSVRGVDDVVFRSNADGRMQPLGLYVPRSYDATRSAALVVVLHGQRQSENDVVSAPGFQSLADTMGAIVAAPYARGDTQFADPAPADIYQAVDQIENAFNVDRSHVFLAGVSMGGFGVYHVGGRHPEVWSGFLSIMGGLDDRDRGVLTALRGKRVYFVSAAQDQTVAIESSRRTVRDFRGAGIDVRYYEQPSATHSLSDVFPSVRHAWSDMFADRLTRSVIPPRPSASASARQFGTPAPAMPGSTTMPGPTVPGPTANPRPTAP